MIDRSKRSFVSMQIFNIHRATVVTVKVTKITVESRSHAHRTPSKLDALRIPSSPFVLKLIGLIFLTSCRNSGIYYLTKQEQQRLAVGPGNAHVISIRQVSSDAAMLQRGR